MSTMAYIRGWVDLQVLSHKDKGGYLKKMKPRDEWNQQIADIGGYDSGNIQT
jgi:hypothetical protein